MSPASAPISALTGAAGEHFVMSQLLRRGLIAALAPQGAPNLDIIVSSVSGHQQFGIQVKSRRGAGSDGGWHMRPKHCELAEPTLFYCFVNFEVGSASLPVTYVVPSEKVAKVLTETHQAWLSRPGKNGHIRKDNPVRRLLPDYSYAYAPDKPKFARGWLDPYREAWSYFE